MTDARVKKLAELLINYSVHLQPGENVLIESIGDNEELLRELIKTAYAAGGNPFIWKADNRSRRELLMHCNEDQLRTMAEVDGGLMARMDAYIGVRGADNSAELSDVPSEKNALYQQLYWQKVHSEIRCNQTRWVVLRYPSPAMAQQAKMSSDAFENFFFDVCLLDYGRMGKAMEALQALMERTDGVRLLGPGDTDISFSIKDIPVIPCAGQANIPDGEVYTAPVKDSVNGVIHYNAPSPNGGFVYEDVRLVFRDGKIVEASANDSERINELFNMDEGARYVGEFAIGVHPNINRPMGDILFDEKIGGSIHFTPGNAYEDADNGNRSALHWDLVLIQTPEFGGGEMYFDGVLVRKDGRFLLPELDCLNPENLKES